MKPNMDKFNRTAVYGLPMCASVLPGHKFNFLFSLKILTRDKAVVAHAFYSSTHKANADRSL